MFDYGQDINPFALPPATDPEPVARSRTQQVGWEYFAPQLGTMGEMLEAIAEAKKKVEAAAEQAMACYIERRQIADEARAAAEIMDSEILEACPQASSELGRYRADSEAAIHQGVKSILEGNAEFRL
ncbi:MAG: hypothetical protein HC771_22700 [Synechococcales cyanobacterium CRU_2_2]|nr:hypothetical protein [Synechococcales cyanobacterium CRU_2_2]